MGVECEAVDADRCTVSEVEEECGGINGAGHAATGCCYYDESLSC